MPTYIRLHIEAVLMSWGIYSPCDNRRTFPFPSRSGVGGLLGAALGLYRGSPKLDLLHHHIRVHSRVLRKGPVKIDFHNKKLVPEESKGDPYNPDEKNTQKRRRGIHNPEMAHKSGYGPKLSHRHYLSDAAFEVLVEILPGSPFAPEEILRAIKRPKFPIYFGRKPYIPLVPLSSPKAKPIEAGSPEEAFRLPLAEEVRFLMGPAKKWEAEMSDEDRATAWIEKTYPDAKSNFMCLDMEKEPSEDKPWVPVQVRDAMQRVSGRIVFERTAWLSGTLSER